jgi:hypothetical protein
MLETNILVYTKTGPVYQWNMFSKNMLDGSLPKNKCEIYIDHTSGVRCDVLLDICSDTSTKNNSKNSIHTAERHCNVTHVDLSKNCTVELNNQEGGGDSNGFPIKIPGHSYLPV